MPKFNVKHITRYQYPSDVTDSANQIILYPLTLDSQEVKDVKITIEPNTNVDYFYDFFGNKVGMFTIIQPHNTLEIKAEIEVETHPIKLPVLKTTPSQEWEILKKKTTEYPFMDFIKLEKIEQIDEIQKLVNTIVSTEFSIMEVTTALSSYINENFTYKPGVTNFETQIDEIWKLKVGVCQDFAHLLLAMLRMLGIPARYVSGYISPSNHELRGEGATHAWVEVYIPNEGWFGNDPTNNCWVSDRHIKIAVGRDFKDCTPVKGTYKGTSVHKLEVSVIITNEHTKQQTAEPEQPLYVSQVEEKPQEAQKSNSYRLFLEMQQQQQQQ